MNGLVIISIGIVELGAGYLFYGRWLAKKWGIDPNAKTPAYTHEDGEDYVPSSRFTVFSHQFSSIAGAGPVTGPILASVFGWVPVLLWLIIGGLFFGAVQDFGALYASVKNEGKSMGMIIEKYIGKTGRKLFMLFCWLFTLLVIAAFTDMVAGTFVGKGVDGMTAETSYANSAAASISMLFIVVAVVFGLIQKHVGKMNEVVKAVVAIALLVAMFAVGMALPICTTKSAWIYIVMAYLFLASVMPMWLLMQPRDYMTTFMLLGMIIGAVVGVLVAHPAMQLNAFNGFTVNGSSLFPTLFVTIACGAVSGFGRMSFQELFYGDTTDPAKMSPLQRVLTNKYFATVITLFFGYLLTLGGYNNVWPLFGSANQLLAALVLIALAVFLKTTGRTGWTLYIPMFAMLAVTFTALIQKTIALVKNIAGGQATFLVDGLQFIVAVLLMVLGVLVAFSCLKKLFGKSSAGQAA